MTVPLNISSDDAAFFQASTPDYNPTASDGGDDDEDTEDPIGRGESRAGRVDMFRARPQSVVPRIMRGSYALPSPNFVHTPGFDTVPWGAEDEGKLRGHR
jgi:hypothetical protein